MSKENFATNDEIKYASAVLLPKGHCFMDDEEKVQIIKCNESKDIVACPGSGKTTTLLAKLLILANRMPLEENKGVCVLTHTNVAIDEIKEKLGTKSDVLFRYPNHFGTIQSFVDKFLLIPYYDDCYKRKVSAISDELYGLEIEKVFNQEIYRLRRNQLSSNIWSIVKQFAYDGNVKAFLSKLRLISDGRNLNVCKNDGKVLSFCKPRRKNQKLYEDWSEEKKEEIKNWFTNLINVVHRQKGILTYQDTYEYSMRYVCNNPQIADAICSRFGYVFIDEMQDTAKHQLDILEKVLGPDKTIIQRFGDPSQSIYNKVSVDDVWTIEDSLPINTSKRFGENIGAVLRTVCIKDNRELKASAEIDSLSPILILYDDPLQVLPKFCELLLERTVDYLGEKLSILEVSKREKRPIKAVGWVGNELDEKYPARFKLKSYFGDYHKEVKKTDKVDYRSLKSFLRTIEGATVKEYKNKIIEAMLHILRIQGMTFRKNKRRNFYTKTSFLAKLAEEDLLDNFNRKCSNWILEIDDEESTADNIRDKVRKYFIKKLFPIWGVNAKDPEVNSFLDNEIDETVIPKDSIESQNLYCFPGNENLEVEVSNIHQVKGETHTATLYLETSYDADRGNDGYESERIVDYLKGNWRVASKVRIKESLKMAYVGMSRPRYMLCMAIHKDRFDEELDVTKGGLWEIVET